MGQSMPHKRKQRSGQMRKMAFRGKLHEIDFVWLRSLPQLQMEMKIQIQMQMAMQ